MPIINNLIIIIILYSFVRSLFLPMMQWLKLSYDREGHQYVSLLMFSLGNFSRGYAVQDTFFQRRHLIDQGLISLRVRTSPNLGQVLGDTKNVWLVLCKNEQLILTRNKTSPNSLWNPPQMLASTFPSSVKRSRGKSLVWDSNQQPSLLGSLNPMC